MHYIMNHLLLTHAVYPVLSGLSEIKTNSPFNGVNCSGFSILQIKQFSQKFLHRSGSLICHLKAKLGKFKLTTATQQPTELKLKCFFAF